MSKGRGKRIVIKFDKALLGDVTGNESAFTVSGLEKDPLFYGEMKQRQYAVEKVERYPLAELWRDDFAGALDGVEVGENGVALIRPDVAITDSKCYEVTSGTTLTGTVTAKAGDIVLATVSHRSAFTTPSGWTKLYESIAVNPVQQRMVFATKVINADGQVSFTATQSTAGRMYLNLISVSGLFAIELAEGLEAISETTVTSIDAPDKPAGAMLIWGCSAPAWLTSGQWATSPADLVMVSLPGTVAARQANFYDDGAGAATGRAFVPSAGTGTECVIAAVSLTAEGYQSPGTYTTATPAATLPASPRLRWTENLPTGTIVTAEYAVNQDKLTPPITWAAIDNADLLTIPDPATGYFLWLRFTLATTDTAATPTLLSVWLEEAEAPPDTILLTMTEAGLFNDVEGDLTVAYNQALGNLAGTRPVASFEESFTPTDLEPTPVSEHTITAKGEPVVNFIPVYYHEYPDYAAHTIAATAGPINIVFIHVDDVPP